MATTRSISTEFRDLTSSRLCCSPMHILLINGQTNFHLTDREKKGKWRETVWRHHVCITSLPELRSKVFSLPNPVKRVVKKARTEKPPRRRQFMRSWVRIPLGSEISLSPCGPISFLGLSLRRYYLGYLLEYFNLRILKTTIQVYDSPRPVFIACVCCLRASLFKALGGTIGVIEGRIRQHDTLSCLRDRKKKFRRKNGLLCSLVNWRYLVARSFLPFQVYPWCFISLLAHLKLQFPHS